MFFEGNAAVTDLFAYRTASKKAKLQSVQGRIYHSLSFRISGVANFEADGKHFTSSVGTVVFMPEGFSYNTEVPEDGEIMVVHFKTHKKYNGLTPAFIESGDPEIENVFKALCDSYVSDGDNDYKCMSLFYSILDKLDRQPAVLPKRMRLAKNFIDKNFTDKISIESLAYGAGLSDVHFRNEFKKYFGLSPLAYIKKLRLEKAKHLLRSGFYNVTDVALECGFESISYFSYEFRRLTGVSPTDYIKKYQKN